jgi:hypothetical protein
MHDLLMARYPIAHRSLDDLFCLLMNRMIWEPTTSLALTEVPYINHNKSLDLSHRITDEQDSWIFPENRQNKDGKA